MGWCDCGTGSFSPESCTDGGIDTTCDSHFPKLIQEENGCKSYLDAAMKNRPKLPDALSFLRRHFKLISPINEFSQAGEICFSTKTLHHLQNEGGEKSWEMPSRFLRGITRPHPI